MPRGTFRMRVERDDKDEITVICDQRDLAAAEGQGISPDTNHTWLRFLAFNALRRTGQYGGTWERFNTVDCVSASAEPAAAEGDDDADPPGQRDRGAGS